MKDKRLKQQSKKYPLALLVLFFVCVCGQITHAQDIPKLAEKALAATVYLEMTDTNGQPISYGSGFFVSSTTIVTNFHVVAGTAKGTAKSVDKTRTYRIQGVVATDTKNDLAILKVKMASIKRLRLGNSDKVRIGEKVYVAGNPKGLEGTFSDGIISRISTQENSKRLQMTAPISPGSSGGPVLNSTGEVIGVAFMTIEGGQNLNFAIPAKYVKTLLDTKAPVIPLSQVKDNISAQTYYDRGNTKLELGLNESAVLDYTAAIHLKSDFVEAYFNRGSANGFLSKYAAAIMDFDTVIRLAPDYAPGYYNRGLIKRKFGKPRAAIMDYNTAIRLNPRYVRAYDNRGVAKASLGQHAAAIIDYDTVIRLNPDDALAYNNRGRSKYQLGQHAAAIIDYDIAIRLEPDYTLAYVNRGITKGELGQYFSAMMDFDTAIRIVPDYANAYFGRGMAKAELGRTLEAKLDLHTAKKLATQAGDVELKASIEGYLRQLK